MATARMRLHPATWRVASDRRGDRGSMLVELAGFVLPGLVVVMAISVAALNVSVSHLDLGFTAAAAARAASLQRTPDAAQAAAQQAADTDLANKTITCTNLTVDTDVTDFRRGGTVTVTISCTVSLGQLTGFASLTGSLTARSSSTAPVDTYRQVTPS